MSRILKYFFTLCLLGILSALFLYFYFLEDLPNYKKLSQYEPPIITKIYAHNGDVLGDYAFERRIFTPISRIPKRLIDAFLAIEDKNFYAHEGLDYFGILRAVFSNIYSGLLGKKKLVGGSTITQQVAKNFLLSREKKFSRKIKEALLAIRIERNFSKEKILELYLNQIYLGHHAYGVTQAALAYFNKPLSELTITQCAYIASLAKGPNLYSLSRYPKAARARCNLIIQRMRVEGFISAQEEAAALSEPLVYTPPAAKEAAQTEFFSELVRRYLEKNYGEDALYKEGLEVYTTLDNRLQQYAHTSLKEGLIAYDRAAGWRGPLTHIPLTNWQETLQKNSSILGVPTWTIAVVLGVNHAEALIGLQSGKKAHIPFKHLRWARPYLPPKHTPYPSVGKPPKTPHDVLKTGDVIAVKPETENVYSLQQVPEVNGGLVAIEPKTGRILALEGGFSFQKNQFNWVTQAERQTGSAFKPFVYLAALENGFSPTSIVQDEPIDVELGPNLGHWTPHNITKKTFGSVTLRTALEKSLNLATVWLGMQIGMEPIRTIAQKFKIYENPPHEMAIVLGSKETNLLQLTTAYAMLANGGTSIAPHFIDFIQDRQGKLLFKAADDEEEAEKEHLASPVSVYQILSMLQGSMDRGAGRKVFPEGTNVGGKSGTSNNYYDTWFIGTSPHLTVGVLIGFDKPKSLGRFQTGSRVAGPVFAAFMRQALKHFPQSSYPVPPNTALKWVHPQTGQEANALTPQAILEVFPVH